MITKKQIASLVEIKKENNFSNHFFNFDKIYDVYFGEILEKEIFLWKRKRFLRTNYPLFYFSFNDKDELVKVLIVKKPFWYIFPIILIFVSIIFSIQFYKETHSLNQFLLMIFWFLITQVLVVFLLKNSVKYEASLIIKELESKLLELDNDSILREFNVEKTKKVKKKNLFYEIFIRILFYPFCIIIFFFSIYNFFEKPFLCVFGILISAIYLISDILILKGKKHSNYWLFRFLDD